MRKGNRKSKKRGNGGKKKGRKGRKNRGRKGRNNMGRKGRRGKKRAGRGRKTSGRYYGYYQGNGSALANGTQSSDCLASVIKYMKQIADIVKNFENQRKRAERQSGLMVKKNSKNKTEPFAVVAALILAAGGGNKSNMVCANKTGTTEAKTLTSLYTSPPTAPCQSMLAVATTPTLLSTRPWSTL